MLSEKMVTALSEQINVELGSAYTYMAMSAWCEKEGWSGASKWFRLQSQEEKVHADKLFDFVLARGACPDLKTIAQPQTTFQSLLDVFQRSLTQEEEVSRSIDRLYELAHKEKAFAAGVELQWFLTEQVEEERTARLIVMKLKRIGDDDAALLDIDRELAGRGPDAAGA
jgi:ferritin